MKKPIGQKEHSIKIMKVKAAVSLQNFRPKVEENIKAYNRNKEKFEFKEIKEENE